jgi:hypothetical protein
MGNSFLVSHFRPANVDSRCKLLSEPSGYWFYGEIPPWDFKISGKTNFSKAGNQKWNKQQNRGSDSFSDAIINP